MRLTSGWMQANVRIAWADGYTIFGGTSALGGNKPVENDWFYSVKRLISV
jgi:hypothetical protein